MRKNRLLLPLRHLLTQPLTTQLAGIYKRYRDCRLTTLYLLLFNNHGYPAPENKSVARKASIDELLS